MEPPLIQWCGSSLVPSGPGKPRFRVSDRRQPIVSSRLLPCPDLHDERTGLTLLYRMESLIMVVVRIVRNLAFEWGFGSLAVSENGLGQTWKVLIRSVP